MNMRHYLQPQVGKYKRLGQECRKLKEAPQGDLHNRNRDMSPYNHIGMPLCLATQSIQETYCRACHRLAHHHTCMSENKECTDTRQ